MVLEKKEENGVIINPQDSSYNSIINHNRNNDSNNDYKIFCCIFEATVLGFLFRT